MAKVIKELVTKWTYKVDARQITRASSALKTLRNQLSGVRKSSIAFGNKEKVGLMRVKRGWDAATVSARRYATAARGASVAGAGGLLGGGRGGRGGRGGGGRRGPGGGAGGGGGGVATLASAAGIGSIGASTLGLGGLALGGAAITTAGILGLAGRREQAEIAFTGFLKSGEKAKAMLNDLTQFAKKTPFQIPQLRELSSALLAGGFAAEEVIPSLRSLGDVTRGNSDKLQRMLINFIQIKTVGKASALDLKQFALAGIPIFGALQKVTGKNGEQIRKMGKQGKITFKIIKKAFRSMTGEGGLFFNAMELQSKTFFGRLSNIKDSLIDIGETMGSEILPEAKEIAKAIQEWLGENKGNIVNRFRTFVDNLALIKNSGINLIKDLGLDDVGTLKIAALAFAFAIGPVTTSLAALVLVLTDFAALTKGNKSLIGTLITMFGGLDFKEVVAGVLLTIEENFKGDKVSLEAKKLVRGAVENMIQGGVIKDKFKPGDVTKDILGNTQRTAASPSGGPGSSPGAVNDDNSIQQTNTINILNAQGTPKENADGVEKALKEVAVKKAN